MKTSCKLEKWLSTLRSVLLILTLSIVQLGYGSTNHIIADFDVPNSICEGTEAVFMNTSNFGSNDTANYIWLFEGTTNSYMTNGVATWPALDSTRQVSVTLKAYLQNGDSNTISKNVTIHPRPKADFTWDRACQRTAVNFDFTGTTPNGGVGNTIHWNINDEILVDSVKAAHLFDSLGTKHVELVVDFMGLCSDSISKTLEVKPQPHVDFSMNDVCECQEIILTNLSQQDSGQVVTYQSDLQNFLSADSSCKGVDQPGTHFITFIATMKDGCDHSITRGLQVNPLPNSGFTFFYAGNNSIQFKAEATGLDIYRWQYGEGRESTSEKPLITYEDLGDNCEVCLATRNSLCWNRKCEIICPTIGIDELQLFSSRIDISPNPTSGKFTLDVNKSLQNPKIQVLDVTGKQVSFSVENSGLNIFSVNANSMASGLYFIQVYGEGYSAVKKLIIQN